MAMDFEASWLLRDSGESVHSTIEDLGRYSLRALDRIGSQMQAEGDAAWASR